MLLSPIRAIAFDLWNTLAACTSAANPMVRLLEAARAAGAADPGRLLAESTMRRPLPGIAEAVREMESRLGRPLARGEERARLLALWERACGLNRVFDDVEPVLRRLRERYRLGLISNTQSFDMEFWRRSPARGLMEVEILSCEEGALKPDRRLFERFAAALGVAPGHILMVGDNSDDDIRGAQAAGFQAVRIRRPPATLSHRESGDGDSPIENLEDLERRLGALSDPAARSREAAAPSRGRRRGAAAARKKRR